MAMIHERSNLHAIVVLMRPTLDNMDILANSFAKAGVSSSLSRETFEQRGDRTFRQFFRDYRAADDVIGCRGDRKPGLMLPLAYGGILRSCYRYRVGLAEGFMHDHEWDGLRISL